ncbi:MULTISPECIES: hypothetical protein [Bacillales]|uniref:hypothetical protein n=1 Tax=Bacillales TaxID=1385 RepID=UPI0006A75B4D|nr:MULTISPECIES: hypothetical protein [Bacillales]OBZ13182.1 alcohol acetyltransferase [Bacillus sp. FJAT-26390]
MDKWYKLDNAAKLFPSVANTKNTSVYRISAVLRDPIEPEALQLAADTVFDRFPMFTVKLRKGVFWNYLDANNERIVIAEEQQYPCPDIDPKTNNGYLFKVLYYKNRVSIEVFHSLTDGNGAIEFLKSLLYYYLANTGQEVDPEGKILLADTGVDASDMEDSFRTHFKDCYVENYRNSKSYHIKGTRFEIFGNNVVHGIVSGNQLNQAAKQKGSTVTAYLTALLIYSIYQTRNKYSERNEPVVIAIPANLRKMFPSRTLRNFFGVVNIGAKVTEDTTFDELVARTGEMLKQKTSKQNLQSFIYNNVALERNKATMFVPLFLKSWFVNWGFQTLGESKKTMTLSNLGNIILPQQMYEYIEQIEAVVYPTNKSPISCGICTVNDRMAITFTRNIVEADILQYFFAYLANQAGLEVKVYSNDWGRS